MSATIHDKQNFHIPLEGTRLLSRRNKYDILADILAACKKLPRTKSWLLTHLRLSTSLAKKSLSFLVAAKLLEVSQSQNRRSFSYKTTARGKKALEVYATLATQYFST
jgi:predicted transcriptional regulator